jgi:hypothetical protein
MLFKHLSKTKWFDKTIEVFLAQYAHLSSFRSRPYTRTNFPCPKAGITTALEHGLPGKEKLSIFCHTHEQINFVKEKSLVCAILVANYNHVVFMYQAQILSIKKQKKPIQTILQFELVRSLKST